MAQRTRFLLAYDIRDPKRLRRVHEIAKSWGDPLQYSIFLCDLTRTELIGLKSDLILAINRDEDSISIFDLGAPTGRGVECIEFIGTRRPLPPSGPQIW